MIADDGSALSRPIEHIGRKVRVLFAERLIVTQFALIFGIARTFAPTQALPITPVPSFGTFRASAGGRVDRPSVSIHHAANHYVLP
ncbi:hypothetical protein [Allochromatium tepidum]|uniref:hypothetical protein n=1 Tax=Allochromatium tepidum TaxID=553982 RepID=UPI001BCEB801|nr:hypothetical protein [Allochromatium tepidum]